MSLCIEFRIFSSVAYGGASFINWSNKRQIVVHIHFCVVKSFTYLLAIEWTHVGMKVSWAVALLKHISEHLKSRQLMKICLQERENALWEKTNN